MMEIEISKAQDEAEIRALLDERARAIRAKNVDGAMAGIAPEILAFDMVNPLQNAGFEASRKHAEEWICSFQGPVNVEVFDLKLVVGDEVAFSHSLNRVVGTKTDAKKVDMHWRATIGYRKIDGKWMITHEHNSVPFDPSTGKASLELRPRR